MATEEDFFAGKPVAWGLYEALKKELVWRYPEMEVRVAKTQVSFFDRLMFGCVSFTRVRREAEMPAHFLTLTLGLPEPVDSPRIAVKCEPYPLALYPVTMQQIMDIADSGKIMPPKATWFEPKLRSGLVIHKLV